MIAGPAALPSRVPGPVATDESLEYGRIQAMNSNVGTCSIFLTDGEYSTDENDGIGATNPPNSPLLHGCHTKQDKEVLAVSPVSEVRRAR
ncbi:hypothetical protein FRC11_012578 [Ceratobasidium sp. 423]|nr:hypothetical protein FRC11_012578 [Ceratobasidium sp. 423]